MPFNLYHCLLLPKNFDNIYVPLLAYTLGVASNS